MHIDTPDMEANRGSSAKTVACVSIDAPGGGRADMLICCYLTQQDLCASDNPSLLHNHDDFFWIQHSSSATSKLVRCQGYVYKSMRQRS